MLTRFHQRIAEKTATMNAHPVLIVALGDSVTHGLLELDVLDQHAVYHHQLREMLIERHPGCVFNVINAGIGGDSAPGGLARLDRDVISHQPDLVLVGYALNDACGGAENLPKYKEAMSAIVARVRRETKAELILLTPNFMNTRDNDRVAPPHRQANLVEMFMKIQNGGMLGQYAQAIRDLGARERVPVADVYAQWEQLAKRGVDTTAMLSNGLNHPNAEGHRLAAETIFGVIAGEC